MPDPDARMSQDKKALWKMNSAHWSLTYWFTDGRNMDTLNQCLQLMPENWKLEGQIERGKNSEDKEHGQFYLKTDKTRGSKVAKYFPSTDIQEARNVIALKQYVHKEETRVAEFKTVENRSPDWRVVRDRFFDWIIETEPFYGHIKDDLDERVSPRLELWDKFINISIAEGMMVELVGVNPQYRSAVRRYWQGFISQAEQRATPKDVRDAGTLDVPMLPPSPSVQEVGRQGGVVRCVRIPE